MKKAPDNLSQLELDLLLLYFSFSDQHGVVDIPRAKEWAQKKLGVTISNEEFTIEQNHIDLLMDRGVLPDIRPIIEKLQLPKDKNLPPV